MTAGSDIRDDGAAIDYRWIMETTFILTVVVGAPLIGLAAMLFRLPTWADRVRFAVPVAASLWLVIAVTVYVYANRSSRPTR